MARNFRTLLAIVFLAGLALLLPAAAFADPPTIPPLTPPAPPWLTCRATGGGPICRGEQHFVYPPAPSGLVCGTAAHPVELLIDGADNFRITRYYDTAGSVTGRFVHEDFAGTVYNPETGLTAQ